MALNQYSEADNDDANLIEITVLDNDKEPSYGGLFPIAQSPLQSSLANDEMELLRKPSLNFQFGTEQSVRPRLPLLPILGK